MTLRPLLSLALLVPAAAGLAGPPPAVRQAEARAEDFTLRVTQIMRSRSTTISYDAGTPGYPVAGQQGRAYLQIQMDAVGTTPLDPLRIAGLSGDIVAVDENGQAFENATGYLLGAGPAGASLAISAASRSTSNGELALLYGELIVFPSARQVRLEVPWPRGGEAPVATVAGVRGALKTAVHDGTTVKILLRVEVPDGVLGVDELSGWGDLPVYVIDGRGDQVPLRADLSAFQVVAAGTSFREYSLELRGVSVPPARVGIEVLARRGTPRRVPFRFVHLRLPEFADPAENGEDALSPYVDQRSTSSVVSTVLVRGQPAGEGIVLLGLSRQQAPGTWGAWRWKEIATDAGGRWALEHLRPGRYRVVRLWRPQPRQEPSPQSAAGWINARQEFQVVEDRQVALPPLEIP
jgi:hypothetical protein